MQEPAPFTRHNIDYVPLAEATPRYKRMGAAATRLLSENIALGSRANELEQRALIDPLTGLNNETAFNLALNRAIEREQHRKYGRRQQSNMALLNIDVDEFKAVNDTFGHRVGDEVLRTIGGALQASLRPTDMPAHLESEDENNSRAARPHGDEFVVLIQDITAGAQTKMPNEDRLESVKARLRDKVTEAIGNSPHGSRLLELGVGVSIGGIFYKRGESAQKFLDRADAAMYKDKRNKHNRRRTR
jgi:diguanylate cyclase (GGDEF)-like protein